MEKLLKNFDNFIHNKDEENHFFKEINYYLQNKLYDKFEVINDKKILFTENEVPKKRYRFWKNISKKMKFYTKDVFDIELHKIEVREPADFLSRILVRYLNVPKTYNLKIYLIKIK